MQAGSRGYVPVVRTSIAHGMEKLGNLAFVSVSRAILESISAVFTNSMACLSKNADIIYKDKTVTLIHFLPWKIDNNFWLITNIWIYEVINRNSIETIINR